MTGPSLPNARNPETFERRVLLATLGKSPAVLTETLFHLACQQSPPFVPTEIHVITTAEGAHRAKLSLLASGLGKLKALSESHGLPR